jgi:hypothetical protein
MSRPPLELTIFEKHPATEGAGGPVYRVGGSFTPYAIVATEKRFTDAELAAELLWTVFHEAQCEVEGRKLNPEDPRVDHWIRHNREYARQAPIVERFATLPHYDEETS